MTRLDVLLYLQAVSGTSVPLSRHFQDIMNYII